VTDPGKAVFLSYASQDAVAAGSICKALRAAGIEVWFDQSELRGGDAWDQSIRRQIKTCTLFLPIISRNTHDRDEGYFRLEWKLAVDRCHLMAADKAFLLPVVIDDTRDDDERVPERFREVQWTQLPGGVTPAAFVERVRLLLSGELSQEPKGPASEAVRLSVAPTAGLPLRVSWRSKAALIAMIAVAVVALGYLVANRHVLSKRGAEVGAVPGSAAQSAPSIAFNPPPHSIAVLPFVNMSGDQAQEYFSDGITEELLDTLSRIEQLQVAARTSSFSFKGQTVDTSTIARKLNVGALLEGSVRRAGNTVRITVQLIDPVSGFRVWSQTFDRDLSNILQVQTEVATAVAQQLKVKLAGTESAKLEVGGTTNPDAYDAYLRGEQLYNSDLRGQEGWRTALAYFDKAIALDPNYASAYTGRARAFGHAAIASAAPEERATLRKQAIAAAERAVALAPSSGEAHSVLASIRSFILLDFSGAAPEHDRAMALAPGSAQVQRRFGGFASLIGNHDTGITALRRAVALDPQNFLVHTHLGMGLLEAGRYDEALAAFRAAATLIPASHEVEGLTVETLLDAGESERARSLCASSATPLDDEDRLSCLARAYYALDRRPDAQGELSKLRALGGDRLAYVYAKIYACWGDSASALRWLSRAEQLLDSNLQSLRVEPCFRAIRDEPQYKAIEAHLNFPRKV
jgi:TolB-like protein